MNIALFSNHLAQCGGHGISRYAHSLLKALRNEADGNTFLPVVSRPPETDAQSSEDFVRLPWGRHLTPLTWTLLRAPALEYWLESAPDIVHALDLGFPVVTRCPLLVTVHDIGPLSHPQFFKTISAQWMRIGFPRMISKADRIICVSQATADAVMRQAPIPVARKIHVVPEGVSDVFLRPHEAGILNALPGMPASGTPFILGVGALSPRKNLANLLTAFEEISRALPHHLVLAGGAGWESSQLLTRIKSSAAAARIHILGYVSDDELCALYHKASVFVYASRFEGFGLPVIEAMACGCPVITSNCSSLPEVAGEAAILVDPLDPHAIGDGILQVCRDTSMQQHLRVAGLRRSSAFTWKATAETMLEIYRGTLL